MKVLKSIDLRVSKISFILLMLITGVTAQAQVAINKDGSSPNTSAMLDVKSTDKGLLIPRLTEVERDAISSPATGLMVFQTDNTIGFYYYDGSNWKVIGSGAFSIDDLLDGKADGNSVFLGEGAGENDGGTFDDNVAVGYFALTSNTTGIWNTASGSESLFNNISGSSNTASGFQSLENNTTGNYNTAIGLGAGFSNIGSGSVYIGYNAGYSETGDNKLYIENSNSTTPLIYGEFDNDIIKINGDFEVTGSVTGIGIDDLSDGKASHMSFFLGENAGMNDNGAVAHNNTAVGYEALKLNTDALDNTAFGANSLKNSSANLNTAIGSSSLSASTSGMANTAVGKSASQLNTLGNYNVALGAFANYHNEEGSHNTIIGADAGRGSAVHNISGNVFLGYGAGFSESGNNKLYIENTTSSSPLIYGEFDNDIIKINGDLEVTGTTTIDIGIDDLSDGKTDGSSVFLGDAAGVNNDGTTNANTAIGPNALHANTIGVFSTAIGNSALRYSTESNYNTACGAHSLLNNSTGEYNTVLGFQASNKNKTGSDNISIGTYANKYNETGSRNTIIGSQAGSGTALHNKSDNVFLGYCAGFNETGDNKLYIENSNSTTPLIYGEFDNDILAVNGDLGVGTQTPGVKLHVVGGTDAGLASGGYLVTGTISGQNIVMDENEIMARNNGATSTLHLQRNGGIFRAHTDMVETSEFFVALDGKTGIGENSPTAKLHINTISGEDGLRVQINGATKLKVASNGGVSVGYNPTTPTFALQLDNSSVDLVGRARAYSWNTYSDGRLKTNQKVLDYGLKEVMLLQPKSYFHHDSETNEDGTFVMVGAHKTYTFGFIAQELNQIIPEAVYVPKDETKDLWSIDYEKLIPVLTKAMQEQQEMIEQQQQTIAQLKTEIEQIKKMMKGE